MSWRVYSISICMCWYFGSSNHIDQIHWSTLLTLGTRLSLGGNNWPSYVMCSGTYKCLNPSEGVAGGGRISVMYYINWSKSVGLHYKIYIFLKCEQGWIANTNKFEPLRIRPWFPAFKGLKILPKSWCYHKIQ